MEIYPAVDLYEGKVVRLERGDYQKSQVYSEDPAGIAQKWVEEGARWLHVVDLEGAKSGEIKNWKSLRKIVSSVEASVQFGGGARTKNDVEQLLQLGVKRVILGTKVLDSSFMKDVTKSYGRNIALSFDLRGEEVQIEGWLRGGKKSIFELLPELDQYAIQCVIVTDIERDGTLGGMNFTKMKRLLEKSPLPVILSGGVGSLEDIRSVASLWNQTPTGRLDGLIIGKALYEGKVKLSEALRIIQGARN